MSDPNDYMAKKPLDVLTAEAWNRLVEIVLSLQMRVELLERELDSQRVDG